MERIFTWEAFVADDGDIGDFGAGAPGEQLPGHQVAVMLQFGEQDNVAGVQVFRAPGGGDEVDAFGGAAGEDDFIGLAGMEESGGARAGGLEGVGGAVAQFVDAAMHIGIVVLVIMGQRRDDGARLLRGGSVVQVHQRFAVNLLVQDGKILAQLGPINGGGVFHGYDFWKSEAGWSCHKIPCPDKNFLC